MPKLTDISEVFIKINQDYLTLQNNIQSTISPSSIITIIGKTRSGRSTLLNQLFDTKFDVSVGIQPLTISSFSQYSPKSNSLIVDVQGFGTNRSLETLQRLLVAIMMVSDIVLVNSPDGHINQQQIRRLGIICGVLNKFIPKRSGKTELIWIVQSFGLKLQDKNGNPITEDQYLTYALEYGTNSSQTSIYYRQQIKKYFGSRKCVMIAPKQSPNYSLKQVSIIIKDILHNKQPSIIKNIQLLNHYIRNLLKQLNTITNITNCIINIKEVYKNTLMDYIQSLLKQHEVNNLLQMLETQSNNDIIYPPKIKQIWQKFFDIQVRYDVVSQVQLYCQTLQKNLKIERQFQKKTQSVLSWLQHQKAQDQTIQQSHNKENLTNTIHLYKSQTYCPLGDLTNFSKQNFKKDLKTTFQKIVGKQKIKLDSGNNSPKINTQQSFPKLQKINLKDLKIKNPYPKLGQKQQKQLMIEKLEKMYRQQQQSYIRRLNLSKQYINRLENQQQILRKQLFYHKKTINDYQIDLRYLENIEVFQCWKCLQKITNGLVNHMKICQGKIYEQLTIKVLSSEFIKGKLYFNILVKVIPTKQRKWQIRKKLEQLQSLSKYLVKQFQCQGLKCSNKSQSSKRICVQSFLNKCCINPIIYYDEIFRQFIAGKQSISKK